MIKFGIFRNKNKAAKSKPRKQASRTSPQDSFDFNINWRYLLAAGAGLALIAGLSLLPRSEFMPIEKIRISGEFKHLDSTQIERQLEPFLGAGFFSVDIKQIHQVLHNQAWISQVSVRRVWPNMLSISLVEKKAFARWDDQHLLSAQGEVFEADPAAFAQLPLINGYTGQSRKILQRYLTLKHQFAQQGIQLSELREDGKVATRLLLDKQLAVSLGSDDNAEKVRHMLAVYQRQIRARAEHIEHIDFRYSNGFAISWKDDYLQQLNDGANRGNKNV